MELVTRAEGDYETQMLNGLQTFRTKAGNVIDAKHS